MEKLFITADSLLRDSMELARLIYRSGLRPTFLVAMWRGGAPIGIVVQEVLEYHGIHTDHIPIRTSSYTGIDKQSKTVRVHATDYLVSRQWTVWRILSHDMHHGGQIAMMLAIQGIEAPELRTLGGHIVEPPTVRLSI